MRTNLVDGLIMGLGISGFVLGARWLFGDALILWQVAVIILGALVLAGMQMALEHFHSARTNRKAIIDPTTSDTTLLHSPRMAWDTDPPPTSEYVPALPTQTEPPAEQSPSSLPADDPPDPPNDPILPKPTAEHSPEKMV